MEWAQNYYNRQSETFASGTITDQHRAIAARLHGWCAELPACGRLLELGAGAGGTAAALADLGHDVWAVEFNRSDAALARRLAETPRPGTLTVVECDFYEASFDIDFDFVFYWDGFGIGQDDDQRRLLRRIASRWLAPNGQAMIDVFSPWNWQRRDGESSRHVARDGTQWQRTVNFDAEASRLVDHWQPVATLGTEAPSRSQTIRCYTLPEFERLVHDTGLHIRTLMGMDGRVLASGDAATDRYLAETNGFYAMLAPDA